MPIAQVDIATPTPNIEVVDVLHAHKLHSLKSSSTSQPPIPVSTNLNNNAKESKAQVATAAEGLLKPASSPKRRLAGRGHERKKSAEVDVRKLAMRSAGGECNRPGLNGLLGNGVEGLSSVSFCLCFLKKWWW